MQAIRLEQLTFLCGSLMPTHDSDLSDIELIDECPQRVGPLWALSPEPRNRPKIHTSIFDRRHQGNRNYKMVGVIPNFKAPATKKQALQARWEG